MLSISTACDSASSWADDSSWEDTLYPDVLLPPAVDRDKVKTYADKIVAAAHKCQRYTPAYISYVQVEEFDYLEALKAVEVFNKKFSSLRWSATISSRRDCHDSVETVETTISVMFLNCPV